MTLARNFKLGDRVAFVYRGNPPFTGETMIGEVIAISYEDETLIVWRDAKWRTADAIATRISMHDVIEP